MGTELRERQSICEFICLVLTALAGSVSTALAVMAFFGDVHDRTLTDTDSEQVVAKVLTALEKELQATLR